MGSKLGLGSRSRGRTWGPSEEKCQDVMSSLRGMGREEEMKWEPEERHRRNQRCGGNQEDSTFESPGAVWSPSCWCLSSQSCLDKVPLVGWFKTIEILSQIWRPEPKIKVWAELVPPGCSEGESWSLLGVLKASLSVLGLLAHHFTSCLCGRFLSGASHGLLIRTAVIGFRPTLIQ